jgi:hypothetical protein
MRRCLPSGAAEVQARSRGSPWAHVEGPLDRPNAVWGASVFVLRTTSAEGRFRQSSVPPGTGGGVPWTSRVTTMAAAQASLRITAPSLMRLFVLAVSRLLR